MPSSLPSPYQRLRREMEATRFPPGNGGGRATGTLLFADAFVMPLPDPWSNQTVYVLEGPEVDNHRHTIRIVVEPGIGDASVADYAGRQIERQTKQFPGGQVLRRDFTELGNETPAYTVWFQWTPDERPLYQRQLYVVHEETGYRLSAVFTKKTRRTVGPEVEQIFESFEPHPPASARR